MAKRRMFSNEVLYDDDFMDLSHESFRLYIYAMCDSDNDGIFKGIKKLMRDTQTKKEHLKELLDKGFIRKEPNEEIYAITDFHIHNSMEKNGGKNQNRYSETKHISFKNVLFVSENYRLTLDENEGFMPYRLYCGGAMSNVLSEYRKQMELDELTKKQKDKLLEDAKRLE